MCKSKRNIGNKIIYLVIIKHIYKDICVISYLSEDFTGLHGVGTSSPAPVSITGDPYWYPL